MNSTSALRQYIRDLEAALDKMKNEAATQAGGVRTLDREKGDLESKIATQRAAFAKILAKTDIPEEQRKQAAQPLGIQILALQKQLDAKAQSLAEQKNTSEQLDKAVVDLQRKHDECLARVRELERIDRDSKAKEQAAQTVEYAGRIVGSGADLSVDDIEGKMRARNDVANEKFARAMGSAHTEPDPGTSEDLDKLFAELSPKS